MLSEVGGAFKCLLGRVPCTASAEWMRHLGERVDHNLGTSKNYLNLREISSPSCMHLAHQSLRE
jgi:hypothetical protein